MPRRKHLNKKDLIGSISEPKSKMTQGKPELLTANPHPRKLVFLISTDNWEGLQKKAPHQMQSVLKYIAKYITHAENVESERDLLPLSLPCSGKALLRKHQMNRREKPTQQQRMPSIRTVANNLPYKKDHKKEPAFKGSKPSISMYILHSVQ